MKSIKNNLKSALEAAKSSLDTLNKSKHQLTDEEKKCLDSLISAINATDFPLEKLDESIESRF